MCGILFLIRLHIIFIFIQVQLAHSVTLISGVQYTDNSTVYMLCCAHHKYNYHLSPYNTITISLCFLCSTSHLCDLLCTCKLVCPTFLHSFCSYPSLSSGNHQCVLCIYGSFSAFLSVYFAFQIPHINEIMQYLSFS